MEQRLVYAAPADDVRDIVSAYYFADFPKEAMPPGGIVASERAAIAQVRFVLHGGAVTSLPLGAPVHVNRPVVFGPTTGQTSYEVRNGIHMVGCGLLPCGWHAMTKRSAADYINRIIVIDDQFARPMLDLVAALREAPDFAVMVRLLDEAARALNQFVNPEVRRFVHIVDEWLIGSIAPELNDLYEQTNLSQRQVVRMVKHLYGVPPKLLARKYRALRIAKLLHAREADSMDYGNAFYDQSHMIREIKQFTGQTPQQIRFDNDEISRIIYSRSELIGNLHPLTALT